MKILITGSSGHLGEALTRHYRSQGVFCKGIDIQASPFTDHVGSVVDKDFVMKSMRDIDIVIHTATFHKPHIVSHSKQDFVDLNVTGTLNLLEAALAHDVKSFIFTSTTSTFGHAMNPQDDQAAVWVTEELACKPKNIYGITKIAAENLCRLFYQKQGLPCIVLRTSRFFLELDDSRIMRSQFEDDNIKVNEFLNRRVDIADVVQAHELAIQKAEDIGFGLYIISASSPFQPEDLPVLNKDAPSVVKKYFPDYLELFQEKNWQMFPQIGRVYVNNLAKRELGWKPKHDFGTILHALKKGENYRSTLAQEVGAKGYHKVTFKDGPYPVDHD